MELEFKNISLVTSNEPRSDGREIVIKRSNVRSYQKQTRLLDVFEFHPAGVLYKDETGIGATTLELRSPRNSVIVEPIKITASSKAKQESAFYVGSPTKNHPKKFMPKDLIHYINDSTSKHKKII